MPTEPVIIRPGKPSDARRVAVLSRDLIETGLDWSWRPERVQQALCDPDVLSATACHGDRVIAFAVTQFSEERAHLSLLAVDRPHQRQGIGRRLVEWTVESAYAAGVAVIHLETRAANHGARRFYRALGFEESAYIPGYYGGREMALKMLLDLRRSGHAGLHRQQPAPRPGK